jgi:hypothetical protein
MGAASPHESRMRNNDPFSIGGGLPRALTILAILAILAGLIVVAGPAHAQNCRRTGTAVTCDDGRIGQFTGDAIVWPDGTRSRAAPHPSVIIGNRPSIRVGPGVFVGEGKGKGSVPLDDPNSPHKQNCALLDGVSYCY